MDNRLVRIPVPAAIMRIAAELKAAYDSLLWAILLRSVTRSYSSRNHWSQPTMSAIQISNFRGGSLFRYDGTRSLSLSSMLMLVREGVILRNGKRRRLEDNDLKVKSSLSLPIHTTNGGKNTPQEPVNDAFNETVRFAREEGSHKIANLQSSGTFSPQELLAIACYQITYDTRHSGYLEDDVNDDISDAQSQASLEIVEEDADEISQQ